MGNIFSIHSNDPVYNGNVDNVTKGDIKDVNRDLATLNDYAGQIQVLMGQEQGFPDDLLQDFSNRMGAMFGVLQGKSASQLAATPGFEKNFDDLLKDFKALIKMCEKNHADYTQSPLSDEIAGGEFSGKHLELYESMGTVITVLGGTP